MNDISKNLFAMRADANLDGAALAGLAAAAIENKVPMISVEAFDVATIWTWLEKTDVKIVSRLEIGNRKLDIECLSEQINDSFRNGAHGVQLDLALDDLAEFCGEVSPIRDDLFFNKGLIICLDLNEVNSCDPENIFKNLKTVRADTIMFRGMDENFVGRVYALVESIQGDFNMNVYFELIDTERMDLAYRLFEKMRPEILPSLRFFVG